MEEDPITYVNEFVTWKKYLKDNLENNDQPYIKFCEYIQNEYPDHYQNYKTICLYFAKSIKYIDSDNTLPHNNDSLDEICSYLNFWLNSELRIVNNPNMDANKFYSTFKIHNLSENFHTSKCHKHIKKIDDPVFVDLQYLNKLCLDIISYRNSTVVRGTWDCEAATRCYTSYNERVSNCDMQDNASFCEQLKEFHSMYNKTMGINKCQGLPTSLQPPGKKSEHDTDRQGSLTTLQESPHDDYFRKLISNAQTPFISSVGVISTFVLFYKVRNILNLYILFCLPKRSNILRNIIITEQIILITT
ncbi:hypothetical protein PVIIG_05347 [Plasmodium vivax India VII]|uniref:Uncharacterized protein n=1 Tax=Plasmodium vivax India VII TaxID=1077284 RepID=A0A0J9S530_PLAVI|nr:hypothetical protein PVIIG_05347 [Plasmodium vivax India VII]